jgi:hypothetical protein
MSNNLFIGTFGEGWTFADRSVEQHGDYKKIAFYSFARMVLEIKAPRSKLLPEIKEWIKAQNYMIGDVIGVTTSGQTRILGSAILEEEDAALAAAWRRGARDGIV